MAEIQMCTTNTCEIREKCYRFMAPPSMYQEWGHWEPKGKKCEGFVPVKGEKK